MKRRLVNPWILGFVASCIFAYIVTNIFMDSLDSHEYEPSLGKYTYTANKFFRIRREGWATTYIGKYNTFGNNEIDKNDVSKYAIWGDSEVTAFPVPDAYKMGQQLTNMFSKIGQEFIGFGIAHSNNTLADYIVDLSKYESLIPNIASHYIVLCNLKDDTLPPLKRDPGCTKFEYHPEFRLVTSVCRPRYQSVFHQLSKYNMRMVSYFFGEISGYRVRLPWNREETDKSDRLIEKKLPYDKLDAWEFILGELRRQSSKPITFLYCPYRPAILGKQVSFEDPDRYDKEIFADICKKYNIGFIDLSERFNDFFLKTNKFPRGFANTFPGRGHLNIDGQRLVAEAIFSNELNRNSLKQ